MILAAQHQLPNWALEDSLPKAPANLGVWQSTFNPASLLIRKPGQGAKTLRQLLFQGRSKTSSQNG
jgi:hypothetical protein